MRTPSLRILTTVFLCGSNLLSVPQQAWGADSQIALTNPSPSSASSDEDGEVHIRRRIPRVVGLGTGEQAVPANDEWLQYQVSASLNRWLKHFGNPVVCNMIFCHTSCADFDDSCPSFRRPLLEQFADDRSGCGSGSPQASSVITGFEHGRDEPSKDNSCCSK